MLQKFAMVKYGVFVAKICKHAFRASAVRDIWWSPLARQLLPPWLKHCMFREVQWVELEPHNSAFLQSGTKWCAGPGARGSLDIPY